MAAPHACTQRDARDSGVDLRRALTGWSCRSGSDPRPLELNHLHADRVPPVLDPDRLLSSEFQPIRQFGKRFLETLSVPFSADVAVEAEAPPTMDAKVNAETGPFLPRLEPFKNTRFEIRGQQRQVFHRQAVVDRDRDFGRSAHDRYTQLDDTQSLKLPPLAIAGQG